MTKLFIAIIAVSCFAINSYAFTVSLQVSNKTNQEVKPEGGLSSGQVDQPIVWQESLPTMNHIIAQHATNIPVDALRKNLDNYDLEYFNFNDMNNKLLVRCLSSYYTASKDMILRFTLYETPGAHPTYSCQRESIKRSS
ncbi:MAG: hypothetical protein ACK4PR_00130 [Gammaproteobacteria bacterium]